MFARLQLAAGLAAALTILLILAGCSGGDIPQRDAATGGGNAARPVATVPALSEKAQAGEAAFNARCALCHGVNAAGTNQGPPLVHPIYEPGHHQDFAFRNAVRNGVAAHHWQFGNMPAIPGVPDAELERIVCYIRELQRANGIFADAAGLAAC